MKKCTGGGRRGADGRGGASHYGKTAVAPKETILLMAAIDEVVPWSRID